MKVVVKKVERKQSIIEVGTREGVKTLTINKTPYGHSYDDFAEWAITDSEYEQLENFTDGIIERMQGDLEVEYDLG